MLQTTHIYTFLTLRIGKPHNDHIRHTYECSCASRLPPDFTSRQPRELLFVKEDSLSTFPNPCTLNLNYSLLSSLIFSSHPYLFSSKAKAITLARILIAVNKEESLRVSLCPVNTPAGGLVRVVSVNADGSTTVSDVWRGFQCQSRHKQ